MSALEPPGAWQVTQFWRMAVVCGMVGGAPAKARVPPSGAGWPMKLLASTGVASATGGLASDGPGPDAGAWH